MDVGRITENVQNVKEVNKCKNWKTRGEERENKKGDGRKLWSSLIHEAGFGREILETTREEEHFVFEWNGGRTYKQWRN